MKIAVLFDGGGLARLGLEQAGHDCVGFELDPTKVRLSQMVGSGNCIVADATKVDLTGFDGVWASPPCTFRSQAFTQTGVPDDLEYKFDFLSWCLDLDFKPLWVENVLTGRPSEDDWGPVWNAAQFTSRPLQNRNRIIGGVHRQPQVYRPYNKVFRGVCPTITGTEYKGCATDDRRASRFYGRRLTVDECAYHQGFKIPDDWRRPPDGSYTQATWNEVLYEVIGNGVPVYMSYAFGKAHV